MRAGPSRTTADYDAVCAALAREWARIVGGGDGDGGGDAGDKHELRAVFVLGSLIAGAEAGFALPAAGEDGRWMRENRGRFQELADAGDEDFVGLVEELRTRPCFKGALEG